MAVTTAATGPRHALHSRPARRLSPWLSVAVIAGVLVAWYVVIGRGGWTYDDNLYFTVSHTTSFGKFVDSDLFGHWTPGYKAVFWLLGRAMPIDYRWALAGLLLLLGGSAYLFARIIDRLVGGRWIPTLAGGYLALSVLLISSLQWFSAGLQTVPTIAFDLLCLWAYLRYQERRSLGWAVTSAVALLAGLLFYEEAVLMLVFLLAIRVFVQTDELRPGRIARAIWTERAVWIAYVVVLVAYWVARDLSGASSVSNGTSPTLVQWAQMYWLMWAKTLVPAMFGLALPRGSVGPGTINGLQLAIGIVLQVVVWGAILVSLRRRTGAWRAWAALAVCILAVGILIGIGRFWLLGVGVATDPRYVLEFSWLIPLFACLAFGTRLPLAVHDGHDGPARAPVPRATPPRILTAAVALLAVGYLGASVATAANWEDGWPGVSARTWETNVESSLVMLGRHRNAVIAEAEVPQPVLQSAFVPFNFLSYILPRYGSTTRVDGPLTGPLYTISPSGRARPARIERVVLAPTAVPGCGRSAPAGIKVQARIAHPPPTGSSYYLLIGYRTPAPARFPLYIDYGNGFGSPDDFAPVGPSAQRSIVWLGVGSPHAVLLSSAVGAYVCVRSVEVVSLGAG